MSEKRAGGITPAEPTDLAGLVEYSPGSIVSRALTQAKTGSLTLFAFDAGQELSEHTAPFDAHVIILDGSALVTIGGLPITVKTGQVVLMPAHVAHGLEAKERFKMLLVMIRG